MRARLGQALAFVALAGVLSFAALTHSSAWAQRNTTRAPTSAETGETSKVDQINNWTVGLVAGLPQGTFIRFGAEIARNLNKKDVLRVLPIMSPGATSNIRDLLYLKGIDLAITNADVLEHFKTVERIPNIERRVHYISEMVVSETHVVARPEINSLKDLEGKVVSFHTKGAGSSVTGPIIFRRTGIKVKPVYVNNAIALEKMKTGEIVAIVNNGAKPQRLLRDFDNTKLGFKILDVPIDKFDEYYIPATLTHEDYPQFIKEGEKVETLGIQTVLAVYNWPRNSDRYRRVKRFIDRYFDMFENFHKPPYHPKWKSTNLAANVPGWTRYFAAEEKLREMAAAKGRVASRNRPGDSPRQVADQEALFRQFLEWSRKQGKR